MLEGVTEIASELLGTGRSAGERTALQMALRALVLYVLTLTLVRLGSKRFLGKATAFDVILGIMIGSVMSRGINGSADVLPTLAAGGVLIALHWLFAVLAYHTDFVGALVKGHAVKLIEDGAIQEEGLRETSISHRDLDEALREEGLEADPERVKLAYMERDGSISVIERSGEPRIVEVKVEHGVQTVRVVLG